MPALRTITRSLLPWACFNCDRLMRRAGLKSGYGYSTSSEPGCNDGALPSVVIENGTGFQQMRSQSATEMGEPDGGLGLCMGATTNLLTPRRSVTSSPRRRSTSWLIPPSSRGWLR